MFKKIILGNLLLFSLLLNDCVPEKKKSEFSTSEKKELDEYLSSILNAFPIPGMAVAVVKDGAVYYKTFGNSAPENPFSDDTLFFTGNISELMVATAILKMAESGKIKLDEPVVKHLPYFELGDNSYKNITIKHLVTQTGGIPHHAATWDMPSFEQTALTNTTQSIHLQPAEFSPPGSRVLRSPYNYDILADLIRNVSGTSFEEYTKKHVFETIGLTTATFDKNKIPQKDLAQPHSVANWLTYEVQPDSLYPSNKEHAGSIGFHSDIKDISAWMQLLLNEDLSSTLLSRESRVALTKAHFKTGKDTYIGFGWEIKNIDGINVFNKNHQLGGFSADMILIPEQGTGVFVFGNISGDFNSGIIGQELVGWLNGGQLSKAKPAVGIPMGKSLHATGSLDSAFQVYDLVKVNASDKYDIGPKALGQLGVNLMYRLNDKEKALEVFKQCAEIFPNSAHTQINLAEVYLLQGNAEKAKQHLFKAKSLKLDYPENTARIAYIENVIKER